MSKPNDRRLELSLKNRHAAAGRVPKQIYLDYNASTPIAPEVVNAMRPFLDEHYGIRPVVRDTQSARRLLSGQCSGSGKKSFGGVHDGKSVQMRPLTLDLAPRCMLRP